MLEMLYGDGMSESDVVASDYTCPARRSTRFDG
jgi:hypothetical protein